MNSQMQTTFYAANDEQRRRNIIDAAHTEALNFNDSFSVLYNRTDCMNADIWVQADVYDRFAAFEMAHTEALEIDADYRAKKPEVIEKSEMKSPLSKHNEYVKRAKANGTVFIIFKCPNCEKEIETQVAPVGQYWDSLSTCPHCEGLFIKITIGSSVTTEVLPE